ncbi:MAG: tRNA lysidine(34) synthetase TilS [Caldimonas sp.]
MDPSRVAVAYSGGRDSTALLHATLRAAEPLGIEVVALHVHHGLSPNADAWLEHCRARCARWAKAGRALEFGFRHLPKTPEKGESIEAWARKARYAALREMARAHAVSLVLLAHHRRDQAETFLLQALRGAGVAGLAGMPRLVERDGVTWARPWLLQADAAIDAYVRRHRLAHIEDESNADERYARNRLRRLVWPSMIGAFPQAEASFATTAAWAHEAAVCLGDLAAIDLERVAAAATLDLDAWSALSGPRRSNALRAWLRRETGTAPSAALVTRLSSELAVLRSARWPLDAGELRSHRGTLTFARESKSGHAPAPPKETSLTLSRSGTYRLPGWGGLLRATRVREAGVALDEVRCVELLPRIGSEQFQIAAGRPARSLKKQYQAAGVPTWQRGGPLIYSAGRLIYVPGLGIDARAHAPSGKAQITLQWIPTPA